MLTESLQGRRLPAVIIPTDLNPTVYQNESRRMQGILRPTMVGKGVGSCQMSPPVHPALRPCKEHRLEHWYVVIRGSSRRAPGIIFDGWLGWLLCRVNDAKPKAFSGQTINGGLVAGEEKPAFGVSSKTCGVL